MKFHTKMQEDYIVIITGDDIFVLKDTFKTCRKKTLRKSKS